jgi:hypothetical protein
MALKFTVALAGWLVMLGVCALIFALTVRVTALLLTDVVLAPPSPLSVIVFVISAK